MTGIVFALKLAERCPHCGTMIEVRFRRRMPDGQLEACIADAFGLATPWREVTGFEDVARLSRPELTEGRATFDG